MRDDNYYMDDENSIRHHSSHTILSSAVEESYSSDSELLYLKDYEMRLLALSDGVASSEDHNLEFHLDSVQEDVQQINFDILKETEFRWGEEEMKLNFYNRANNLYIFSIKF
jgi:hypothetical protein